MESQATSDMDVVHHDDLTVIPHIGQRTEERLNDAGIVTYADLAEATPEEIFAALKGLPVISLELVREYDWIGQAKRLAVANRPAGEVTPAPTRGESAAQSEPEAHRNEAFMLRLLLDREQTVVHTYISSIQSQKSDNWPGWDPDRERQFIARNANARLEQIVARLVEAPQAHPAGSRHANAPAAAAPVERAGLVRGSLLVVDWQILEGERQLKHLVLVNQPFDLQLDLDTRRVNVEPGEALLCEVSLFARNLRSGERMAIGRSQAPFSLPGDAGEGSGPASAEALRKIKTRGLIPSPGEYQIEAIVVLKPASRPDSRMNQAAGLLEGVLIRAYEGS